MGCVELLIQHQGFPQVREQHFYCRTMFLFYSTATALLGPVLLSKCLLVTLILQNLTEKILLPALL